jgi:paraquat-inducible protein B
MLFGKNQLSESESHPTPSANKSVAADAPREFPSAVVREVDGSFWGRRGSSYMWVVALVCLSVSIGVVWWSLPHAGLQMTVHFPDGHGLAVEDNVRFRGIDVGVVESVELNQELSGVDVSINLFSFAEHLARAGTRFWIVRPQLGFGGVSGLETAVGSKYITLLPGPVDGAGQLDFQGLSDAPPDSLETSGIEILLRGDDRNSVTEGSPVSYRGVDIGRVLSVGLSPDGLKVDVRVRILERYTKLVTSESKFWASSGIDASFSALSGGLDFEMESLETLLKGGVSVLTVANGGRPIKPGDDFELYRSVDEQWRDQADQVQATDIARRGAIPIEISWKQKSFLGRTSEKSKKVMGVLVRLGGQNFVVVPSDVLTASEKVLPESFEISIAGIPNSRQNITSDMQSDGALSFINSLSGLVRPSGSSALPAPIDESDMRLPLSVEPCLVVRANGEIEDLRYFSISIEPDQIEPQWELRSFDGDRSVWHGSPVLSEVDGDLIGIMLVEENSSRIEPVSKSERVQ